MKETYYMIVGPKMVWQWYYDEKGGKNIRELLGYEAVRFIENIPSQAKCVENTLQPIS